MLFDSFSFLTNSYFHTKPTGAAMKRATLRLQQDQAGNHSQNLTRTRATPGSSETYQTCFRTPCPRLWDSQPSTSSDAPPDPRGSCQCKFRLVVRDSALDPWPLEQRHYLPSSPGTTSYPRRVSDSKRGTVITKLLTPTASVPNDCWPRGISIQV